jgi:hypothetical protein
MWVTTTDLPSAASHPFCRRLNQRLRGYGFDDFVRIALGTMKLDPLAALRDE